MLNFGGVCLFFLRLVEEWFVCTGTRCLLDVFCGELDDSKMMAVMSISKIGQLSKANCPATWATDFRLGGGFKYFLFSPRNLGKMNPFWRLHIFQRGWNSTTNMFFFIVERLVKADLWNNLLGRIWAGIFDFYPQKLTAGTWKWWWNQ